MTHTKKPPVNPGRFNEIEKWVGGGNRLNRDALSKIAPTAGLPDPVRKDLARRIYSDGPEAERRKAIRDFGKRLTSEGVLNASPKGLADSHLIDLRGGIAIVRLRNAALQVLGAVEARISKRRDCGRTPLLALAEADQDDEIRTRIAACVAEAERAAPHIEAAREAESLAFLRDCWTADRLLQRLAMRDGVVIVLRDDVLVPGPAFGADAVAVAEGDPAAAASGVPELPRIANLLALTEDISGSTMRASSGKAAE